jgi:hypothetical protein
LHVDKYNTLLNLIYKADDLIKVILYDIENNRL